MWSGSPLPLGRARVLTRLPKLPEGQLTNGVDLSGHFDLRRAVLFNPRRSQGRTRSSARRLPKVRPSFSVRDLTEKFARQK